MATKAYVGVSGTSKNVTAIYVGVNGEPKKVIKGYVGVNGEPKLFWDASSPPTPVFPDSWDLWTSVSGLISVLGITKTNNKIAYYAAIHTDNNEDKALLISTDINAVAYDGYASQGSITDVNNTTWHYNAQGTISSYSSDCLLSDTLYSSVADAAQDLLDKVFNVTFHEDYQAGSSYSSYVTDYRKTIRKIVGIFLYKNISSSKAGYSALSDNADTIITTIVNNLSRENAWIRVYVVLNSSGSAALRVYTSYYISPMRVTYKTAAYGYDYYSMETSSNIPFDGYGASISSSGTVQYTTLSENTKYHLIGFNIGSNDILGYNTGIEL